MNELKFDENLAIREVLDDILGMVDRREKLIDTAAQQAEKSGDERMAQHVEKLQGLMSDFLTLFEPIMSKVRRYGETLRESITDSERYLKSLVGIIDAGKSVEGTSATVQELEKDADGVQEELQLMTNALGKIEDLSKRAKQYGPKAPEPKAETASRAEEARPRKRTRTTKPRASRSYLLTGSRLLTDESSHSQD